VTGLVFGAIIISFSSVMVRLAGVPPDVAGFYRLFVGGLGMLALLWHMGKLGSFTRHIWKWSLLAALFFGADISCWHRSINLVGPGLSTMLANFQVVILAAVSVIFLKEKLTWSFFTAIGLALAGLYLMVGVSWEAFTPEYQLGVVFGLLAAVMYALYLLSLRFALTRSEADPLAMACGVALLTGLGLGGVAVAQGESFAIPGVLSLVALAVLALGCHAGGWFLITRSMQQVRTSLVGLILLLQPTLSMVWDILFFGKPVNGVELTGVALALVGIYMGTLKPDES